MILRTNDGERNKNVKKAIGLIIKTSTFHVHCAFLLILYISLASLHDYEVRMPNFTFYIGSTQATTKFPFSFLNLNMVLRNSTLGRFT